nr:hypothetical protein CFP56_18259 [Quercus suber]
MGRPLEANPTAQVKELEAQSIFYYPVTGPTLIISHRIEKTTTTTTRFSSRSTRFLLSFRLDRTSSR